ncbi:MAG: hypothetical protein K2H64_05620, partial [Desulfovibrio sp.]|nr:hypothetical protein [Desulfovibrio sp.]
LRVSQTAPREVIAGSPKITCLPCYLRQGKNNVKPLPKATDKYDIGAAANYNEQSALRGRKMYWHQRQLATPKIEEPEKKRKVISILHPLARDARAEFEIRVTNLTDLELGCLLEAIDLEDGLAHKIGMGKPFGFGSVRLKIVELDIEDTTERYKSVYKRLFEPPVKLEAEEVGADARVKFRETVMAKVRKKFPEWGKYKSWEELPPIAALRLMLDEKGPKADEIKYMDLDQFAIHAPLPEPEKILRRAPQPAPAKAPRKQK